MKETTADTGAESLYVQCTRGVNDSGPGANGRISAAVLVALRYRVAGELVDVEEVLGRARGGCA